MITILLVLVVTSAAFSISAFAEESNGGSKTVNLGKDKNGHTVTVTVPEITEAEDSKIDGFLIGDLYKSLMFCAFVSNIGSSFALIKYGETNLAAEIGGKLLEVTAFGALMIFAMFKSSGIAKTVVGAH